MQPIVFLGAHIERAGRAVGPSWRGAPAGVPADPVQYPPQLQPVIFAMAEARAVRGGQRGVGPSWQGRIPLPAPYQRLVGVTKDSGGNVLAGCAMQLFRTIDNALIATSTSGADGSYEFRVPSLDQHYVVAYKAGAPDVAGTTVNTLIGSA